MSTKDLVIVFSLILATFIVLPATAQLYLEDDFSGDDSNWVSIWGDWVVEDGVYKLTSSDSNQMSVIADSAWNEDWVEYTFEVEARKIEGAEAFLILFRLYGDLQPRDKALRALPAGMQDDGRSTQYWWNLGGWGNTRSGVERWIEGARVEQGFEEGHSIETDVWYNIKIENREDGYTLYLNDEMFAEVEDAEVSGGRIGLGSWITVVEYDNVLVYGPEGPTAVSPQAKLSTTWGRIKQ